MITKDAPAAAGPRVPGGPWLAACACATALAAAGCGPAAAAPARPAWAHGLGAGVTVAAPATAAAGQSSPAAAVQALVGALNAGEAARACGYLLPAAQSLCVQALTEAPVVQSPKVSGLAVGYVAIDGTRALVGTTGTYCTPSGEPAPDCFTNRDPAAIFSTARPFTALWSDTIAAENQRPAYTLTPCVKVGAKWYAAALPGDGGI